MDEYLKDWRDEEDVILPLLEKRKFSDNEIIREPVELINKGLSEKTVISDEKESENKTNSSFVKFCDKNQGLL